jgi:signal transduction histidine kinase
MSRNNGVSPDPRDAADMPGSTGRSARWARVRRSLLLLAALGSLFIVLDWLSFIHDRPALNITPWNPPAGMYLAFLLIVGWRGVVPVFTVIVAADVIVRGYPGPALSLLLSNAAIAAVYAITAEVIRHKTRFNAALPTLGDLGVLVGGSFAAATAVAPVYIGVFALNGLISADQFTGFVFQYWLGDIIATTTLTPAILLTVSALAEQRAARVPWRLPRPSVLVLAQAALTLGCIGLALTPFGAPRLNLFHILFIPLTWIAVTRGLPGALAAVLVVEIGLVMGLRQHGVPITTIVYYQTLMLTLAITSLLLGSLTTERARISGRLRQHQAELAHASRLSTAGEMASALAHELNQPLLASISYTRAAQRLLAAEGNTRSAELMDKAVAQSERAGEVIRGLRVFLRKGPLTLSRVAVPAVVEEATALARVDATYNKVSLVVSTEDRLPDILADKTQVEQVLLNLIHNAVEAIAGANRARRVVVVRVKADADRRSVTFEVEDTGPGVPDEVLNHLFSPFATTKHSGMGLGLAICNSIVEAHGGRLYLSRTSEDGSVFRFKIPAAGEGGRTP